MSLAILARNIQRLGVVTRNLSLAREKRIRGPYKKVA
ncbi:hypothetical protein BGP_6242 [Beggiatoa sp. PS]|nr:hypothetical protein BGP_6242 [Beggiatoa sp. PS]